MEAVSIGLLIGVVLGLTGAGGSIFAVPLLVLFLDLSVHEATGIALGAVAASAAFGVMTQRRWVLWTPAMLLALGGAITAPLGRWISALFDERVLAAGFVGLALFIAVKMLQQAQQRPEEARQVRAGQLSGDIDEQDGFACRWSHTGQLELRTKCIGGLFFGGNLVGLASGIFGVGGGFLIIPLLLFLSRIDMPQAIATSLAVITWVSTSGFVLNILTNSISDFWLLIQLLVAAITGMLISRRLSGFLAGQTLQKLFALMLIVVAVMMLTKTFST